MEGVPAHSISNHLGIDTGPPFFGVFQAFQDQDTGALSDDESVTVPLERPGSLLRCVVSGGKGLHGVESGNRGRRYHRFHASGDHGIGAAALNDFKGLADSVGSGGTGGGHGRVGALRPEKDGDHSGGHVSDHHRDEKRAYPFGPFLFDDPGCFLQKRKPSQTAPREYPDPWGVCSIDNQAGVFHSHPGGGHGIGDERCGPVGVLLGYEIGWLELFDFARDLGLVKRGVEPGDPSDPGLSVAKSGPGFFHPHAQGCHQTDAGDDDPFFNQSFLLVSIFERALKPGKENLRDRDG